MSLLGIGEVIASIGSLAGEFIETPKERREMEFRLLELESKNALAQIGANAEEAKSSSLFVSGWRPAVGWVCATALGVVYIPKALVMTAIWTYQAVAVVSTWSGVGPVPVLPGYPDLGVTDLLGLLGALLGFGGLRSFEKVKDVARG